MDRGDFIPWKVRMFSRLACLFIKAINLTCRHRYESQHQVGLAKARHPHGAVAFAFWHEHAAAGFMSQRYRKIAPMISLSLDGEIAAFVARRLGMHPVRGSSSRQGRMACDNYAALIDEGYTVALTVDGPRGPRHSVKPGIVHIASQYQLTILPFIAKASRHWTLSTWDKMRIPKPFSLIVTIWGEPIQVEGPLDAEKLSHYQSLINERLQQLKPVLPV